MMYVGFHGGGFHGSDSGVDIVYIFKNASRKSP